MNFFVYAARGCARGCSSRATILFFLNAEHAELGICCGDDVYFVTPMKTFSTIVSFFALFILELRRCVVFTTEGKVFRIEER